MAIIGDEEKIWLDYIIKLNDRYFSKQKTSGFTSYAILGILGIILFDIIDIVSSNLPFSGHYANFYIYLNNSFNTGIAIIIFLAFLGSVCLPIQSPRLSVRMSVLPSFVFSILSISFVFSTLILNIITIYNQHLNASKIPYKIFSFSIGTILILTFLQKINLYRKKLKLAKSTESKGFTFPKLSYLPITEIPFYNVALSLIIIFSLLLIVNSMYSWIDLIRSSNIIQTPFLIKISIELTVFIFLIFMFIQKFISSKHNLFLENLERRIIVENLTSDEIKKIFVREFLGETTRDWINEIQRTIDQKYDNVMSELDKSKQALVEVMKIDTQYEYEISGRKEKLCQNAHKPYNDYMKYTEEKITQIDYLLAQQAFIFSENELLSQLISLWKKQIASMKNAHDEFCNSCKGINCQLKEEKKLLTESGS